MNWEESTILSKVAAPIPYLVRRAQQGARPDLAHAVDLEPAADLGLRQRVRWLSARRPHRRWNAGTNLPQPTPSQSKMQTSSTCRSPGDDGTDITAAQIVAEALADRARLSAGAEPRDLVVLDRMPVLVDDHVGVLGVVDATAAVLDLPVAGE